MLPAMIEPTHMIPLRKVNGNDVAANGGACRPGYCVLVPSAVSALVGAGLPVDNRSVGGLQALDLLHGNADLGVQPWPAVMARSAAATVVISLGINDSADPARLADYRAALAELARIAQAQGKRVIFATQNPIARPAGAVFAQAMRDVASARGLPLLDVHAAALAHMARQPGTSLADWVPDGLHPNAALYAAMGAWLVQGASGRICPCVWGCAVLPG